MKKTTAYARNRLHALRPRRGDPLSSLRLLNGLRHFDAAEIVSVQTPVRMALQSLRDGAGLEEDFHTVAAAVNISLVRSESIGAECVAHCQAAQAALMRVLDRKATTDRWGLDGPARDELHLALDLYEQILELSTPAQMADAMLTVARRMDEGHVFLPTDKERAPA